MKLLLSLFAVLATAAVAPTAAHASQCWRVTGWTPSPAFLEYATVVPVACTTTPLTTGWLAVENDGNKWVRLDLTDPHITSPWQFNRALFFRGWNGATPIFETDLIPGGPSTTRPVLAWSPDQATPTPGLRGRLRHVNRSRCVLPNPTDGGAVTSAPCTNNPTMTYKLIDASGGKFRLASDPSSKCLYVITPGVSGGTVRNWGCWNDPNMTFQLEPTTGGFRLRHQNTGPNQCPFDAGTGSVFHWVCWNDPEMTYRFDAL